MPNVTGTTMAQAKKTLTDAGLSAVVMGEDEIVTDQLPGAGRLIAAGSTVLLYAGEEAEPGRRPCRSSLP